MLKMYCFEYPITGDHKFMMVYQYSNEGESSAAIDRDEKICFTNEDTVVMQVTSALVDNPQRSYCLQATREKQFFSSTVYTPSTNIIHFDSEEPICFKGNQKQHDNYIFFTMHSQYEGKLNMYNGCICIRSIVGRGEYQVALVH